MGLCLQLGRGVLQRFRYASALNQEFRGTSRPRLDHDLHAIDAASSSPLEFHAGVHRVDNPRGQTCELVCKAAPKLRACIRLEVLFRLKRRHDHFIRATCAGDAPRQQLEQARFLTRCLVVLLKYGALLSDPGQHGMLP